MATTKKKAQKRYRNIRIDEDTYAKLRREAYRTEKKIIDVLREKFVAV